MFMESYKLTINSLHLCLVDIYATYYKRYVGTRYVNQIISLKFGTQPIKTLPITTRFKRLAMKMVFC